MPRPLHGLGASSVLRLLDDQSDSHLYPPLLLFGVFPQLLHADAVAEPLLLDQCYSSSSLDLALIPVVLLVLLVGYWELLVVNLEGLTQCCAKQKACYETNE